jgi:hypothetical protein
MPAAGKDGVPVVAALGSGALGGTVVAGTSRPPASVGAGGNCAGAGASEGIAISGGGAKGA